MDSTKDTKQYTDKQQAFLDALAGDAKGDIPTAKKMAGYSEYTTVREVVEPLKKEIAELTETMLALAAPKAVGGLIEVLDKPEALGARSAVAAAAQVLDRSGFGKKDQLEVSTPTGGIVILPAKGGDDDKQD